MKNNILIYFCILLKILSLILLILYFIFSTGEEVTTYQCYKKYPSGSTEKINKISIKEKENTTGFVIEEYEEEYLGEYTITAYCPCKECNGKWYTGEDIIFGASNEILKTNSSVATASSIPFGTKMRIEGFNNEFIVQDRTAIWIMEKYDNRILDIYVDSHDEIDNIGKQVKKVWIEK